ncbi:MAG: ATP12 family chaperone protein [Albidovulum sp.]
MSGWAARRFWTDVTVEETPEGFAVRLDARPLRTPGKRPLVLPTRALAEAVADEWRAVEGTVDPRKMPFTRSANSAVDKVATQFDEVADLIAAYGGSDLVCYRTDEGGELARRQKEAWDPILDWAQQKHGVALRVTSGIAPVDQPDEAMRVLAALVHRTTPFELTALHDLVSLSGSLLIGLAATEAESDPQALWLASRTDEDWQAELWGADEEAVAAAETKRRDFLHAHAVWRLLQERRR